jgi:hypothetical protein
MYNYICTYTFHILCTELHVGRVQTTLGAVARTIKIGKAGLRYAYISEPVY